jgi:NADH-quinone oxidoreductase subunit C
MRIKVGKTPYGTRWHVLKKNGLPLCGYTSFNWLNDREEKEVTSEELKKLKSLLEGVAEGFEQRKGFIAVRVDPQRLHEAARRLREAGYDRLILVTAVDLPRENRIKVVYHVESFERPGAVVALETYVDRDNPRVKSLVDVWRAALLQEREEHEMLGVVFEGHPDLRRLLLPPDWPANVYPLRKDFRVVEEPFVSPKQSKPIWELKPELKPKAEGGKAGEG